jgi:hypothetical protein
MHRHFGKWIAALVCSCGISRAATFDISSEHYKLAVGQGECSTTVSTLTQKDMEAAYIVAVTADCGSSSLKADPKYVSSYDYSRFDQIIKRKDVASDEEDDLLSLTESPLRKKPRVEGDESRSPSLESSQLAQSASKKITTSLTGESTFEESFDFLIKQLANLDLWIVFLSHPDKDHINWLSKVFNKLPDKTKLMMIAGGEWFNTNSTEDIRDVLSLVYGSKKDRIFSFFPYEDGKLSGAEMQDWLYTNGVSITKDPDSFCPRKTFNEVRLDHFHGTLIELFKVYQDKKPWKFIGLPAEDLRLQALGDNILSKIYIWSLDNPIGNANAQSIVWSHEVDDIGWTFVYTGDAEDSTFKKISNSIKFQESADEPKDVVRMRYETVTPNLIMMQGMHHGSLENVSSIAMDLFRPNAIAFSSGNRASFAHPSITAIQKYKELFKGPNISDLWSSYTLRNQSYLFAAFSQKGEGALGIATPVKIRTNDPVFLCTNAYGTLKINRDGVYAPFNEAEGYMGYYDLHAYEYEGKLVSFKTLLTSNAVNMSNLIAAHEELYQLESFRKDLEGVSSSLSLISELGDSLIIMVNQNYALKAIQKIRKENGKDKSYIYFYVLRKLAETDAQVVSVE